MTRSHSTATCIHSIRNRKITSATDRKWLTRVCTALPAPCFLWPMAREAARQRLYGQTRIYTCMTPILAVCRICRPVIRMACLRKAYSQSWTNLAKSRETWCTTRERRCRCSSSGGTWARSKVRWATLTRWPIRIYILNRTIQKCNYPRQRYHTLRNWIEWIFIFHNPAPIYLINTLFQRWQMRESYDRVRRIFHL